MGHHITQGNSMRFRSIAAAALAALSMQAQAADITSVSLSANTSGLDIQLSHGARQINIDLSGFYSGGTGFALAVAVVPEPASVALLTAGLVAVTAVARRRQTPAA